MELLVIIVVLFGLAVVVRIARAYLRSTGGETRSVDRYDQALRTLRTLPERAAAEDPAYPGRPGGSAAEPGTNDARSFHVAGGNAAGTAQRPAAIPLDWAEDRERQAPGAAAPLGQHPVPSARRLHPPNPSDLTTHRGLAALSFEGGPRPAQEAARIIGLDERPGDREPAVEANARLTGTTGLVLIVLLFLEGLTIPFIGRLVSWHILIGLILVPPLLVKMASVSWRFSRYYLHDPRYRRAGPPHPLLRILGPLVMGSTVLLFASGIDLWLTGPTDRTMFRIHQLTFVFWFVVVAIHVASHLLRATRLAAADAEAAHAGRGGSSGLRRQARHRRTLIGASLVVGVVVGFAGKAVSTAWTDGHVGHGAPAKVGSDQRTGTGKGTRAASRVITPVGSGEGDSLASDEQRQTRRSTVTFGTISTSAAPTRITSTSAALTGATSTSASNGTISTSAALTGGTTFTSTSQPGGVGGIWNIGAPAV